MPGFVNVNMQLNLRCAQSRCLGAVARRSTRARAASADSVTGAGLVFPCGSPAAWDAGAVSNPVIRVFPGDNESRWYMWYTGREAASAETDAAIPAAGKIGVAVSSDGISWTRGEGPVTGSRSATDVGACIDKNDEEWWTHDTHSVAVSDVQMFSSGTVNGGTGVYWMFYTGADYQPVRVPEGLPGLRAGEELEGLCARPGLAMSQDGRNWARIEADHHTHALFDRGAEGEWDALFAAGPQVVAAGPKDMLLYYHSFDPAEKAYAIGLATSEDGFRWSKQGKIFSSGPPGSFDAGGAAAHCVVRDLDTRQFYMFYEAIDAAGKRSIGIASSENGRSDWDRHPEPILEGSGEDGAWDAAEVGAPYVVSMAAGAWRLYYSGKATGDSAWRGIGVALSDGGGISMPTVFERRTE